MMFVGGEASNTNTSGKEGYGIKRGHASGWRKVEACQEVVQINSDNNG